MSAGSLAALSMAPTFYWPCLMVGLCILTFIISQVKTPKTGGWYAFWFGMGYFTCSLYWISNALLVHADAFWWLIPFAVLGLPAILSVLWFAAGALTVRFSAPNTLARSILFLTCVNIAEYARAFYLTGFPWNLFGYTWGGSLPVMQVSAVGGIYFLTILTIFWMATPTLAWQARQNTKIFKAVLLLSAISFTGFYAYGATRLNNNPTKFRNDFAVIIVQPNIPQSEKWADGQAFKNFMTHIELSREALDKNREATVALVWPETSLDENLLIQSPEAARILTETLSGRTSLISGMWRETKDGYYNSIASLSAPDGKLHINGIYDKHHLVPFGEYLPFEKYLNLTPLVGFAGFQKGHGPAVISSEAVPPFASLLCFETIFPWYAQSTSADWIVNTSNDGWYGNTPGPYQHLAMTQFRAVEQGKPIARAATTGVSALIDSYGRITQRLDYEKSGAIISQLPKILTDTPFYQKTGEALFFLVVSLFLGLFFILQNKEV